MERHTSTLPRELEEFVGQVRPAIEQVLAEYHSSKTSTTLSLAFGQWYLENVMRLDEDSAIDALVPGGPGDKGVDGFHKDTTPHQKLTVYQFKYSDDPSTSVGDKDVSRFAGSRRWLQDPEQCRTKSTHKPLLQVAQAYVEALHENTPIEFKFVCFGRVSGPARDEASNFNEEMKRQGLNVTMSIVDLELCAKEYYGLPRDKKLQRVPDTWRMNVADAFEITVAGIKALVCSVPLREIVRAYDTFGERLFHLNLRGKLSPRKWQIKEIYETLRSDESRNKFWLLNNGLTFVCSAFEKGHDYVEMAGDVSMVNGQQTTWALVENRDFLGDESVLCRFMATTDEDLKDNIARTLNSQNSVNVINLRASDPMQRSLHARFQGLQPPWYYEIREGAWNGLKESQKRVYRVKTGKTGRPPYRKLDMETAAKYFRAFQGFPEDTSHDTWRLFTEKERGGVYEDLFVEGLAPEVLKLAWLLGEQVRKSYPDWVGCEKKECTGENLHRFEILAQVLALAHRYRYDVALVGHILGSELGEVAAVDTARKAIETFEGNTCLPLTGADAYLNAAFHYMREFFDARLDTGDPDWSGKLRRRDTDRIFPQLKAFVDRQVRQLGKAWRSPACA